MKFSNISENSKIKLLCHFASPMSSYTQADCSSCGKLVAPGENAVINCEDGNQ
ncbi:MAG: hypothetical protein ACTSPA_09935 [Promethearchaeota archaeon]